MSKLCLANIDYRRHMTDEGEQLQQGFAHAGWSLAGFGYEDDETDVPALLDRHMPEIVFAQDRRDWDPNNAGCFDSRVGFQNIETLKTAPPFVTTVVKDAGTLSDYQRRFAESIGADAIVVYYHEKSCWRQSPWLREYPLIRHYHTVDADLLKQEVPIGPGAQNGQQGGRRRGIVTGAANPRVYPLRALALANAQRLRIDTLVHPGYSNQGCAVTDYLRTLGSYRVHVATASAYGFALRKIIESVACGCTPVTDLPEYDTLPEIDAALVRVPPGCSLAELANAIDLADRKWNIERAQWFAESARRFYDYRVAGVRLDQAIAAKAHRVPVTK